MNKKGMALSQSVLLILGIVAFAFVVGSSFEVVSAANVFDCSDKPDGTDCGDNSICHAKKCVSECAAQKSGICQTTTCDGTTFGGLCPGEDANVCCVADAPTSTGLCGNGICSEIEYQTNTCPLDCLKANPIYEDPLHGQKLDSNFDTSTSNTASNGMTFGSALGTLGTAGQALNTGENLVNKAKKVLSPTEQKVAEEAVLKATDGLKQIEKNLIDQNKIVETLKGTEDVKGIEQLKSAESEIAKLEKQKEALSLKLDETKKLAEGSVNADYKVGSAGFLSKLKYGFFNKVPNKNKIVGSETLTKIGENAVEKAVAKAGKAALRDAGTDFSGKAGEALIQKAGEKAIEEAGEEILRKAGEEILKTQGLEVTKEAAIQAGQEAMGKTAAEAGKDVITKAATEKAAVNAVGVFGYAFQAAGAASMGAMLVTQVFKIAGAGERNMKQISGAATVAAVATTTVSTIIFASTAAGPPGWIVGGIVAVAAGIWAAFTYQDYSQEIFTYKAGVWEPPTGGENCQDCNGLRYGCSEYQCHSYGSACELLNPGTNFEACEWNNSNDFKPPIMVQLDILDINYEYDPMEEIKLPERGVQLIYTGPGADDKQCIPPFTGVKFGVKTDEPAQCKIDLDRKMNYKEMVSLMKEGPVYTYNHTIEMPSSAFPSEYALNSSGWSIDAGMEHSYYIRCQDKNGNVAPAHFVMNFCVDKGPDTTPPTIETNYINGAYISHNVLEVDDVEVYTNEPADCRWDFKDTDYDKMDYDMRECSQALGQYTFPTTYSYGCKTTLTGIKAGETNNYFIRCQDKPDLDPASSRERRISNEESYLLSLTGTNQLAISEVTVNDNVLYNDGVTPDETLKFVDSTSPIEVELIAITAQGAEEEGQARCSYNPQGSSLYFEFYNDGIFDYTNLNKHMLNLEAGDYQYDVRCCDVANNCDTVPIEFEVETDLTEPEISRAYSEGDYMKFVTTEEAECAYSLTTCNYLFEDGSTIETVDNLEHFTAWDTESDLYVKCKDGFGNIPNPDECSIIARANKAPELSEAESVL